MAYYCCDNGFHNYYFRSKMNLPPSSKRIAAILVALTVVVSARSTHAVTTFTNNGQTCECVPFLSCADTVNVMGDMNPCAGVEVCCVQTVNGDKNELSDKNIVPISVTPNDDKVPNSIVCGQWNEGIDDRISGNIEAKFAEFPWMVAILEQNASNPSSPNFISGASLIHPSVVLTGFHRITNYYQNKKHNKLVIRAGEWDFLLKETTYPIQDRQVSKIIKHENYNSGALYNDVALVFVNEPFIISYHVGTICLPPQGFKHSVQRCVSSGWGKDAFGKNGVLSNVLKKVHLPLVPNDQCFDLLKRTNKLSPKFKLHESFMCAGGENGKDTCQGDGGSPLMCPTPENFRQYHQVGIVSWGIGCANETPGVYVDVAKIRHWIDQQMINNNLETTYYDASKSPLV